MFSMWSPPTDVLVSGSRWLVKVELAGICLEETEIVAERNTLLIKGCRRDRHCGFDYCYQSLEIRYSQFERHITFPFPLKNADISWQYDDGMLLISVLRK